MGNPQKINLKKLAKNQRAKITSQTTTTNQQITTNSPQKNHQDSSQI